MPMVPIRFGGREKAVGGVCLHLDWFRSRRGMVVDGLSLSTSRDFEIEEVFLLAGVTSPN